MAVYAAGKHVLELHRTYFT